MSTIKAIKLMTTSSGVIFKTLHFLRNLWMGPIS
jgi:hypothetical protein